MFEVTISIDLHNADNLTNALEFIQKQLSMSKAKESSYNSPCQNFDGEKVADMEKNIEMCQKENVENQETTQKNLALIHELEKAKSEFEKKYHDLESKLLNEEELNKNLKNSEETYNIKLHQKDEEIKKLKKSLESCSVSFGSDNPDDKIFFEVSKNKTLEESTISSDSLYYANKSGDFYKFEINNDGPIKDAISNIDNHIEPFCIIQDKIKDANAIKNNSVGKAKSTGNTLQIIDKAVISLIKQ